VTLSDDLDPLGYPLARLSWQLTDLDYESVRRTQSAIDKAARNAGVGRMEQMLGTEEPPVAIRGHWHHMGTTRMHSDPRRGVVDPNCRVHTITNLYVAGSSVFPTGGYANPTVTIVALALRLADHLKTKTWA
jgi:choline dehydrogenase-like flavoprotein